MAATDVLTVQRAKDVLGTAVGDPRRHKLLEVIITGVSEYLDSVVGPVVRRTVTGETHRVVSGGALRLLHPPVASVSSVVEWRNGTSTTLAAETLSTAGDYLLDAERGVISRRSSWRDSWWTSGVVVTYVAGRYATTEEAQESRFGQAAGVLLNFYWGSELFGVGQVGDYDVPTASFPRTIPRVVREMLVGDIAPVLA